VVLLNALKHGYLFAHTWPYKEALVGHLPLTKQVWLARLSLVAAPLITSGYVYLHVTYLAALHLNAMLAVSILILSMPLHALSVLGKLAKSRLPNGLCVWYKELEQAIDVKRQQEYGPEGQAQHSHANSSNRPLTYMDLAELLKTFFKVH
jgi:uncharacterized membrane protein YfbV (UPF0208 family)